MATKRQFLHFFHSASRQIAMKTIIRQQADAKDHEITCFSVIHPCSSFALYWSFMMLFILIINLVAIPIDLAFFYDDVQIWLPFNVFCDVLFFLDILIRFRSGYIDSNTRRVVLDSSTVAIHYLKGWFIIDVISCFPLDYILLGIQILIKRDLYTAGRLFRCFKFFRIFQLIRFTRFIHHVRFWRDLIDKASLAVKIIRLLFAITLVAHWNGCILYAIPKQMGSPPNSWIAIEGVKDEPWWICYSHAVFKSFSHMLGVAYGVATPVSLTDLWATNVSMVVGYICYAIILTYTAAEIQNLDASKKLYKDHMQQVYEYMSFRKLAPFLRKRIVSYYNYKFTGKMFDEQLILSQISEALRKDVICHNCHDLIQAVPFFRDSDPNFIHDVISKMEYEMFQPGDYILEINTRGDRMFFIREGVVEVLDEHDDVVARLADGSYFGEISLLTRQMTTASVRAASYISLFSLNKDNFENILIKYPAVKTTLEMIAEQRLHQLGLDPSILGASKELYDNEKAKWLGQDNEAFDSDGEAEYSFSADPPIAYEELFNKGFSNQGFSHDEDVITLAENEANSENHTDSISKRLPGDVVINGVHSNKGANYNGSFHDYHHDDDEDDDEDDDDFHYANSSQNIYSRSDDSGMSHTLDNDATASNSNNDTVVKKAPLRFWEKVWAAVFHAADNKLTIRAYSGKEGLRREKEIQREKYMYIIHPFSKFRMYWILLMLCFLVVNLIVLPIDIAFFFDEVLHWIEFKVVCDILFIVDIVLNFRTGVIAEDFGGIVIMENKEIAKRYVKGWFVLDLLGSIPFDDIFLTLEGDLYSAGRAIKIIRLFKILQLFRMLRIARFVRYIQFYEKYFSVTTRAMRIFNLVCVMMLVPHWSGCILFAVPVFQGWPADSWIAQGNLKDRSWFDCYTFSFFKALGFMLGNGYGTVNPTNYTDTAMSVGAMVIGAICYALFLAHTSDLINALDASSRLFRDNLQQVTEYMKFRNLPYDLRRRITSYYISRYSGMMFDEPSILSELSDVLRKEIVSYNCRELIEKVPFFINADQNFLDDVISKLYFEMFQPEDVIIEPGAVGQKMYFIQQGIVEIIDGADQVAASLGAGSYFGEISLLTNKNTTATVKATTMLNLFALNKQDFDYIIYTYPAVKTTLEAIAAQRLHHLGINTEDYFPTSESDAEDYISYRAMSEHLNYELDNCDEHEPIMRTESYAKFYLGDLDNISQHSRHSSVLSAASISSKVIHTAKSKFMRNKSISEGNLQQSVQEEVRRVHSMADINKTVSSSANLRRTLSSGLMQTS